MVALSSTQTRFIRPTKPSTKPEYMTTQTYAGSSPIELTDCGVIEGVTEDTWFVLTNDLTN